jgi:hypothetical protein
LDYGGPEHVRSKPLDGGTDVLELEVQSVFMLVVDDTDLYLSTPSGVWRLPK